MKTKIIKINPDVPETYLITEAAKLVQDGGLVAFPTETVYGIAANFLNAQTLERLYNIKKRPKDKPFTFHIAGFHELDALGVDLSGEAQRIVNKFWPGPLTILCLNKKGEKLGIRMPSNKIAIALIKHVASHVVAPSANISENKPPVSAGDVLSEMDGLIDMIIDGGYAEIGKESTILDVTTTPFEVVREGAVPCKELLCEHNVLFICTGNSCRSVMAKGFLEKFVQEAGFADKVYIDSAGTSTFPGIQAATNTALCMKEEGIDVSMHKGKNVAVDLLKRADLIVVMEKFHRDVLLGILYGIDAKIKMLGELEDISDPIGKDLVEYRRVRDIIKEGVEDIFLDIFKKEKEV